MKIEPVRYSRLIMQLMTPTPIKALRQARSASPSSERRTPGAAAINAYLFKRIRVRGVVLPMFWDTVHLSHVNLNPVHPHEARMETEVGCLAANLTPAPADRRVRPSGRAETAPESPTSRPGRSRRGRRAGRRFRRPIRPPAATWPPRECRSIRLPAGGTTEPSDWGSDPPPHPDRRGAALDFGGGWPRQIAPATFARRSGSAARSAAI